MAKISFAFLLSLALTFSSQARILTVEYGSGTGGQYNTLQGAHDAAISGDTIFVIPPSNLVGITVTKRLTIYGVGFGAGPPAAPSPLGWSLLSVRGSRAAVRV